MAAADEGAEDSHAFERCKADPFISIADLENCFQKYFDAAGVRNLDGPLSLIFYAGVNWKSSPKAAVACEI